MNEIYLTVTGNVASRPRAALTNGGHSVTSFRLASTPRRYDKARNEWKDGPTAWFSVTCWRSLADHAASSLNLGDPVVVHGRLNVREYTRGDGTAGTSLDVDAQAVGHDLTRGTSAFRRRSSQSAHAAEQDARAAQPAERSVGTTGDIADPSTSGSSTDPERAPTGDPRAA